MDTRLLTTHIPTPLADKVDEIAARLEQSSDWVVEQAVKAWVNQQEGRYQATRDGLADVDSGLVYDHALMEQWANSLSPEQH